MKLSDITSVLRLKNSLEDTQSKIEMLKNPSPLSLSLYAKAWEDSDARNAAWTAILAHLRDREKSVRVELRNLGVLDDD